MNALVLLTLLSAAPVEVTQVAERSSAPKVARITAVSLLVVGTASSIGNTFHFWTGCTGYLCELGGVFGVAFSSVPVFGPAVAAAIDSFSSPTPERDLRLGINAASAVVQLTGIILLAVAPRLADRPTGPRLTGLSVETDGRLVVSGRF